MNLLFQNYPTVLKDVCDLYVGNIVILSNQTLPCKGDLQRGAHHGNQSAYDDIVPKGIKVVTISANLICKGGDFLITVSNQEIKVEASKGYKNTYLHCFFVYMSVYTCACVCLTPVCASASIEAGRLY